MALYFCDASALVKYYVTEPGSSVIRDLADAEDAASGGRRHTFFVAEITLVEVAAALAIIERVGRIRRIDRQRAYQHFVSQWVHRYTIVPFTAPDFTMAAELTQRYPLKAYDAVHLAVALRQQRMFRGHGPSVTFISSDHAQLGAARAEGLLILDPANAAPPYT